MKSGPDNSYQTPPLMGLSQWGQHQGDQLSKGDGEDLTVSEEESLPVFSIEPATCTSLWRTHLNPQVAWSSDQGEPRQGMLDMLIQGPRGDWVYQLIEEEGMESKSLGICFSHPKGGEGGES